MPSDFHKSENVSEENSEIFTENLKKKIVGQGKDIPASDSNNNNPIAHAVLNAINNVADNHVKQGVKRKLDEETNTISQNQSCLCTDCASFDWCLRSLIMFCQVVCLRVEGP